MVAGPPVATGYVDLGHTGRTELRIHGVGGTSPQELLDHPHPVQVAGDATSGFYRRWDHDATAAEQPAGASAAGLPRHVEGFSWGGMTSGSARRALWLLLVPFLLVNVAHWALPGRAAQRRWANTAAQRVLRLLALSLTMTLALAAAETGIDLLARQCGSTGCFNSAPSWLTWLRGHRQVLLCLGALLPLAAMVLLAVLGRQTWKVTERVNPKERDAAVPPADEPALADPMFWAGAEPVRRLRAAHFAGGLAAASIVQVLPVLDSQRRSLAVAVLATAGVVIALTALLVFSDGVARPHHRRLNSHDLSRRAPLLAWAAAVVFLLAVIVDLLPHAVPAATGGVHVLPRLDGLVQGLFGAQIAMVVLVGVFVVAAGLRPDADEAGRRRPGDQLVGFALAALAWLVTWFFTTGLTVRLAQTLFSHPQRSVPNSYTVAGALIAPGGAFLLLGIGIMAGRWYRREMARHRKQIAALPPPGGPVPGADSEATNARVAALASARTRAGLLDIVPQLVVAAVVVAVVLACLALVLDQVWLHLAGRRWVQRLADLGTLLLGLAILRFLATARKAWKQGSTRRSLGILWDLGSFWPRAAHPLAPPCYCERALPQLQTRLTLVAAGVDDHVVLAGHSQGSVIAAALMLMHRPEQVQARMSLLTYGCPLGRLYMRAFPGYLGPQVLGVGQRSGPGAYQPALTVRSQSWRWLNLYRETDPIGGYVDRPAGGAADEGPDEGHPMFGPSGATRTGDVDVVLVDPDFAVPPGDIFPPSAAGHSHYREDPTYEAAVAELL